MREYGIENCQIEIVEDGFNSLGCLALAEINYIKQFNSFIDGLNSTRGGDGMGRHILHLLSPTDLTALREALGGSLSDYNKNVKWANTTNNERKFLTRHLHTDEVYKKKSETLKKFYKATPDAIDKKREQMRITRNQNKVIRDQQAKEAGLKGALAMSKSILVEFPDGSRVTYISKSEMQRQTNQWAKTLIRKTNKGITHNGYRAWEINVC